jgi:hypothetical protein
MIFSFLGMRRNTLGPRWYGAASMVWMHAVKSSSIRSIGYDEEAEEL